MRVPTKTYSTDHLAALFSPKNIGRSALKSANDDGGFTVAKHFPGISWLKSLTKEGAAQNRSVKEAFANRLRSHEGVKTTLTGSSIPREKLNRIADSINVNSRFPLTARRLHWLNVKDSISQAPSSEKGKLIMTLVITKIFGPKAGKAYKNNLMVKAERERVRTGKTIGEKISSLFKNSAGKKMKQELNQHELELRPDPSLQPHHDPRDSGIDEEIGFRG